MSPRAYVIATTPRSGSTLLCEALSATGVAGRPKSHVHEPALSGWLDAYGLDRTDYASDMDAARDVLDHASQVGRAGGTVFGLRLQGRSLGFFLQQLAGLYPDLASDPARIDAAFGPTRYVWLIRKDKVAQAVSRLIAEQTGLWHRAADGSDWERKPPSAPLLYDAARLTSHIAEAERLEAQWVDWFAKTGLTPLMVDYDDLVGDFTAVLMRVLQHIGCDPDAAARVVPPMARLSDATNAEWIERYRAEQT